MTTTVSYSSASCLRFFLSWLLLDAVLVASLPSLVSIPLADHNSLLSLPQRAEAAAGAGHDKRAQGQFPSFASNLRGRAEKGKYLLALMPLTDAEATAYNRDVAVASPWTDALQATEYGWVPDIYFGPFSTVDTGGPPDVDQWGLERTPGFGRGLDDAFADPDHPVAADDNILCTYLHARDFEQPDGSLGEVRTSYLPHANSQMSLLKLC